MNEASARDDRGTLLARLEEAANALRRDGRSPENLPEKIWQHAGRFAHYKQRYLRYLAAHGGLLGEADSVVRTFWGQPMHMSLRDGDATGPYFFGVLAGLEYKLVRYLIRTLPGDALFYDVGANYGFYSLLAARLAASGSVHAFEPLPSVFSYLERNCSASSRIVLNNVALAQRIGEFSLFDATNAGHSGGSTLEERVSKGIPRVEQIRVAATTLDAYAQQHEPPSFIKIDVEGGEYRVLQGAKDVLARHAPTVALEVWGGQQGKDFSAKALESMVRMGYTGYRIQEDGTLGPGRPPTDFLGASQTDNIILRK